MTKIGLLESVEKFWEEQDKIAKSKAVKLSRMYDDSEPESIDNNFPYRDVSDC